MYIEPKLKPLYVNLKRLELGRYLRSKDFDFFLIENNLDDQWKICEKQVRSSKLSIRPYDTSINDHEEMCLLFLSHLYKQWVLNGLNNDQFQRLTLTILLNFANWQPIKTDFTVVTTNLRKLNFSSDKILAFAQHSRKIWAKKPSIDEQNTIEGSPHNVAIDKEKIFVVHGQNDVIRVNVCQTIERLGLKPVVLFEQANAGNTIIEKFEKHSNVGCAVVLLTDDDIGRGRKDPEEQRRARQNVVLEMGYFIGKLGRKKVIPLYENGVALPSDIHGLMYIPLDINDKWKFDLARELQSAGYTIDANKLL